MIISFQSGPAKNQGQIFLFNPAVLHGDASSTGGFSRLGHQQNSAGLTVKTVYQRNLSADC